MKQFLTIESSGESLYKDRGSKFLGFAFPVQSEEEVNAHLEELRKIYHDARHHCYAYILGMEDQRYRANDDGEPNHSAGDPILGQVRSAGLTNTLVVVVRYFGGTKLGVSGLIAAYKTAAEQALAGIPTRIIFPKVYFTLYYSYPQTTEAEKLLSEFEIEIISRNFEAACTVEGSIHEESFAALSNEAEKHRLNLEATSE